jgi:hypothetical protein
LEKQTIYPRNRVLFYILEHYAFRKQMSISRCSRRVGDIIISRRGKGVKSTVKQAYASRGEPSPLPLRNTMHRRQRLIVAMSIEISRNNGARQDDRIVAWASRTFRACGCQRGPEESPLLSPWITPCSADYNRIRAIIPPI